jgi:hypothetical protein
MRHLPPLNRPRRPHPVVAALAALTAIAAALALPACGSSADSARPPAAASSNQDPGEKAATTLRGDLSTATVYDATGTARACEPPNLDCAPAAGDREFRDQCKLAGFQVRQCGCAVVCSGNIAAASAAKKYYDAAGAAQACDPPDADCTPPPAKAAYQDACAERGHRLQICGCAWLCTGDPTK